MPTNLNIAILTVLPFCTTLFLQIGGHLHLNYIGILSISNLIKIKFMKLSDLEVYREQLKLF